MGTITGLTAARMLAIEAASVVSGMVQGNDLILSKFSGQTLIAGNVRGPVGAQGIQGPAGAPSDTSKAYVDSADVLLTRMMLANRLIRGGGYRSITANSVGWDQRFIIMGLGKNNSATAGYFDIIIPPNGTVIPVLGVTAVTSATVSNGKVPLTAWQTLYYILPIGSGFATQNANFRIVEFTDPSIEIPATWIPLVTRNFDSSSPAYTWFDGMGQDLWRPLVLANGWVNFGTDWPIAAWRFESQRTIRFRGLIKNGAAAVIGGTGYGAERHMFCAQAQNGSARLDINSVGELFLVAYNSGGTNGWLSLDGVSYTLVGAG